MLATGASVLYLKILERWCFCFKVGCFQRRRQNRSESTVEVLARAFIWRYNIRFLCMDDLEDEWADYPYEKHWTVTGHEVPLADGSDMVVFYL